MAAVDEREKIEVIREKGYNWIIKCLKKGLFLGLNHFKIITLSVFVGEKMIFRSKYRIYTLESNPTWSCISFQ